MELDSLLARREYSQALHLLRSSEVDINYVDRFKMSLLATCIRPLKLLPIQMEIVATLLERGIEPFSDKHVLIIACRHGKEMVFFLFDYLVRTGRETISHDLYGYLHYCSQGQIPFLWEQLSARGVKVSSVPDYSHVYSLVVKGNCLPLKSVLEIGVYNLDSNTSSYPFLAAAAENLWNNRDGIHKMTCREILLLVADYGADRNIPNENGLTAMDILTDFDDAEIYRAICLDC